MNSYLFTDADGDVHVELRVDAPTVQHENFTTHEVVGQTDGLVGEGFLFREEVNTKTGLIAFAEANNLTLVFRDHGSNTTTTVRAKDTDDSTSIDL